MVNFCPSMQVVYVGCTLVELARDRIAGEYPVSLANRGIVWSGDFVGDHLCLVLLQTTGYSPEEPVINNSKKSIS